MKFSVIFITKSIAFALIFLLTQNKEICHSFKLSWFSKQSYITTTTSSSSSLSSMSSLSFYRTFLSAKYNPNIYDDDNEEDFSTVEEGLRYYREYAKRGLKRFRDRDIAGCLADFDRATNANSTQPLIQRGIALYCAGHFHNASLQLERDIEIVEGSKTFKASDLRIWLSACYNKLGRKKDALIALDHTYLATSGLIEQRFIINSTLSFYAGEMTLDDMMGIIGDTDERDVFGFRFFGNFYLGLYYDSIGEFDLARVFLSFPRGSNRYPDRDMWYHVPRYLYTLRGWDDVNDILL